MNVTETSSALAALSPKTEEAKSQNELDQDAFMTLLIAQMQNQDPTEPVDATEQLTQLAQFTQVESLEELNQSMGDLVAATNASQSLQASGLVGKTVAVESPSINYTGTVNGRVDLPYATGDFEIVVMDSAGNQVDSIAYGSEQPGTIAFSWDRGVPGQTYYISGRATEVNGTSYALPAYMQAKVESVSLNGSSANLNLQGVGQVSMSDIRSVVDS